MRRQSGAKWGAGRGGGDRHGVAPVCLDRVIDSFNGELTGYYAAATRPSGIPLANEGVDGSWARSD
jgi:hypothetical protein